MGLVDFLQKLVPKINLTYNDKRKITNTITIGRDLRVGDNIITDPQQIEKFYAALEEENKKDTLPFQLVHKDLAKEYLEYEIVSIKNKDSLKKLRAVLPEKDVELILSARRVVLATANGDKILYDTLLKQLDQNYPEDGRKVKNLISAGYFDEMILPFIDIMKSTHGEVYVEKFRSFYYDILRFFPIAIFVSSHTTEEKLREELLKRLKLQNIPFVRIHAISEDNIQKVDAVVSTEEIKQELLKHNNIKVNNQLFNTPFGLKGQIYEIQFSEYH